MSLDLYRVDSFTDRPFGGNPAGVCLLPEPRETEWMQSVAREMNLSATAFLHPDEEGGWHLRWFTSVVELELCGHGTLASAHVLWETGRLPADLHSITRELVPELRRRGVFRAAYESDTLRGLLGLDRPANRYAVGATVA